MKFQKTNLLTKSTELFVFSKKLNSETVICMWFRCFFCVLNFKPNNRIENSNFKLQNESTCSDIQWYRCHYYQFPTSCYVKYYKHSHPNVDLAHWRCFEFLYYSLKLVPFFSRNYSNFVNRCEDEQFFVQQRSFSKETNSFCDS